ncbi:MAG: helix-turn-helix domain-containing protein [Acidimicrobiales bacterium]
MVTSLWERNRAVGHIAADVPALPDNLRRELQELGLRPYEARVLLGLLRAGSANSAQLAQLSGVPRTSTYQVMEALTDQKLAERVPTHGPAVWTCAGWEAVVDQLDAAEEERLRQHHERTRRLRKAMAEVLPSKSGKTKAPSAR